MIYAGDSVRRRVWEVSFQAERRHVAELRRALRIHLTLWGVPEAAEAAQICATELTSNVINHVGAGTPATLSVAMRGTYVRMEMRDPETRVLPTLLAAGFEEEAGRGMALIDAVAEHRWGVILRADSKVVWCELATDAKADECGDAPQVMRAEEGLLAYGGASLAQSTHSGRLRRAVVEEAAVNLIADLLHWLHAHGCDPEEVLERAQMHFEAEP